ncbi:MAG TPA: substrate-binding domain-containing protein [Mucilaginibacter sp.]
MKSKFGAIVLTLFLLAAFESCKRKSNVPVYTDTYKSGSIQFVSDESFAPILDQEIYIFKNDNTKADPKIVYKPENEAVKYLLSDSSRCAFLSRKLDASEVQTLQSHNLPVIENVFAKDAVAVIVNQASNDTLISVNEIKRMLAGQYKTDKSIVFDNPNSSLVRYLKDFSGEKELKQKNIYALKSNKEVIEYVSKHPEAIGIIGFSWLNDPDADYAPAAQKVKIVSIKDESSKTDPNTYFRPSQETLYKNQYPLKRDLYIINCSGRKGLATGFELFIRDDKGQRIILRSGLLPVNIPERNVTIHNKF